MNSRLFALLITTTLAIAPPGLTLSYAAQRPEPECDEWQTCRQLALEARGREEYERFHDLAWRAVQTGPANDSALLYLVARAASLSGRPRDALVILERLAGKGVVTDAATEKDFDRARQLPAWAALNTLLDRVANASAAPAPASSPSPVPPPAAGNPPAAPVVPAAPSAAATTPRPRSPLVFALRPAEEVARFSGTPFVAGGFAYDGVSGRFLFGDMAGRRVVVVGEGSDTAVDLIREASARFNDITAFEIDVKRGDLWVASTAQNGEGGAVHRLQLISGRALATIEAPSELQKLRLADLAIAANGTVLVLDAAAPRVIGLRPGAKTVETLLSLDVEAPLSITAADDGRAYVAHRDGIVRLDLQRKSAVAVTAPEGIALGGFERIRWHRNALIGVQLQPDQSRHVVRLPVGRGGNVTGATVIDTLLSRDSGPTLATVSGDNVYYLVTQHTQTSTTSGMNVTVKRISLP